MRSALALAAAFLAALAAVASWWSGEDDTIAFFVVLAVVAVAIAALANGSWVGRRRLVGRSLAVAWVLAAVWIGVLLVGYQTSCACTTAPLAEPDPNVAGIPTTLFHVLATYVGGVLVAVATFSDRLAAHGAERR
jgi:hypothetical protein